MKIRGHLVDMPLNFLIVRLTRSGLYGTNLVGGEGTDGSCKFSPKYGFVWLTVSRIGSL